MPRIKIEDLPVLEELTQEEMTTIVGGGSSLGAVVLGGEGPGGSEETGIVDGVG